MTRRRGRGSVPRVPADQAAARRERVEELALRGAGIRVIAREVGSDPRTVLRDLSLLAQDRAQDADLGGERHRLVAAAKLAEYRAWELFDAVPPADANGRLGALGKVLAAQA